MEPCAAFDAEDLRRILLERGQTCRMIDGAELTALERGDGDLLALPYVRGELTEPQWNALLRFHEKGGSLLFLGDTPHVDRWYPYRNSQAPRLDLTRANDTFVLQGLTDAGREVFGDLPELEPFVGRTMEGIRTTAVPPDECRFLLRGGGHFMEASPVVLIERKRPRFFGSRLAIVGFDGGEPRENVLGVCDRPWSFAPGLLNRDWPGCPRMILSLIHALEPAPLAAALDLCPAVDAGEETSVAGRVKNGSDRVLEDATVVLVDERAGRELARCVLSALAPGVAVALPPVAVRPRPGPTTLRIDVRAASGVTASARRTLFARQDSGNRLGFGFSTYRSFRAPRVDRGFQEFVHQMKETGAQYVRLAVNWEDVEPKPGERNWRVPDQLLDLAENEGLKAFFWVFPTARGSGLGEAGIPAWVLKDPAVDRDGRPGNFPCLWSPFYRERYADFLTALARRYARDPRVERFIFDFGNSDFPYGYHYYGGPGNVFDYSPHEQRAFAHWLREVERIPLDALMDRWGRAFETYDDVPVPLAEQTEAWLVYDRFRRWGVHQGIGEVFEIIRREAPDKVPPDMPGHGLGSIADLTTYIYDAKARHWKEERRREPGAVELHNAGPEWGGEPWQVGGRYADYDDALFQSVRLGASYFTIPGPDLGVDGEGIARAGMIRRTLQGASRDAPEIAIIDRMEWHQPRSLAHVGARLDQPVDLLNDQCRFDFSCYRLFALPTCDAFTDDRGTHRLFPADAEYAEELLRAVRRGMNLLLFPDTATGTEHALRRALGLEEVRTTARQQREIVCPDSFGGGQLRGRARGVRAPGSVPLLCDAVGEPVLVQKRIGEGSVLLAGYDEGGDSLDAACSIHQSLSLQGHTLARLLEHLGIRPRSVDSGQACLYKEMVHLEDGRDALLLYSHRERAMDCRIRFRFRREIDGLLDLATGCEYRVERVDGARAVALRVEPRRGYYLVAM
jgi:hypothetical protein